MFYLGLDIHTKHISICVLSEKGQLVRRAQVRTIEEMMRILKSLPDRFDRSPAGNIDNPAPEPDRCTHGIAVTLAKNASV